MINVYPPELLERLPFIRPGETYFCMRCTANHKLEIIDEEAGVWTYLCGGKRFVAGIAHKNVIGVRPEA